MAETSITRARQRASSLRSEAAAARQRQLNRSGRASDHLVSMTVDALGQLQTIEFTDEVADVDSSRWATSLLAVHRAACDTIPAGTTAPPSDAPGSPPGRGFATPPPPSPASTGQPLAPEQFETRLATEKLVDRFADFSARQGELEITGSAREVWLSFDGALRLLAARTTPAALRRGPDAMASAVTEAWQDASRHLSAEIGLEADR